MPWHDERNRLFCIADSWKSQPVQVRRYRGCYSLALSYTRYINSLRTGSSPRLRLFIDRRSLTPRLTRTIRIENPASSASSAFTFHSWSSFLHITPVRLAPRHNLYVVNSKYATSLSSSSYVFFLLFPGSSFKLPLSAAVEEVLFIQTLVRYSLVDTLVDRYSVFKTGWFELIMEWNIRRVERRVR